MPKKTNGMTKKSKKVKENEDFKNICGKHHFKDCEIENIRKSLLKWYDSEQRILPWREIAKHEPDANIRGYAVWVSEIMLQQTQVATVIPYFNKWIEKWPTVKCLAAADIEEVLQMWAGLGYYSRGRRLHEGAKIVMEKLHGNIPDTVPELIKLIPGIGAYSASAIASVAFQKCAGVVDGNVIRVLSRMCIIGANITQPGVRDHLWNIANKIVSKERPGDFNQALMELGAVICTPQNPHCDKCPVNSCCSAYAMVQKDSNVGTLHSFVNKESTKRRKTNEIPDIENIVDCNFCMPPSVWQKNPQVTAFPCKVEKKSAREEKVNVIIIRKEDQFLMVRRPDKGLLAGLWEFPSLIMPENSSSKTNSGVLNAMIKDLGLPVDFLTEKQYIGEVIHLFSHIHTTYVVDYVVINDSVDLEPSKKETKWITESELNTEAVSTAMKKVHALLKKSNNSESNKATNKKRKLNAVDSKQTSLKSFFVKSQA